MNPQYSSKEFENLYTYSGNDLGASWSEDHTSFRVWAPLAKSVQVNLYHSGNAWEQDLIAVHQMVNSGNGTWCVTLPGNLNGVYYTYTIDNSTEVCDPYAHAVGANGQRAMVVDLQCTNPLNWELDCNPNANLNMTDCVIYELHLRDISMGAGSNIKAKGKYLGLCETGTRFRKKYLTGLDHIRQLGVTHVHLLPVFDFGSVDESSATPKYNWGYDPVHFNVPEGSYSSYPSNGFNRIREMKQMIQELHQNGLSVIMDVVYNHVYHRDEFSINQIVPGYFSRQDGHGRYSDGSGCGNDTASERSMVRKFIVDSVNYWADEYHINGFRFDLVGLLDVKTIREIMDSVHKKHPDVIFYGEGWDIPTKLTKPAIPMAIQQNSSFLPNFAFFNDTMRDTMRGSVFDVHSGGFITGGFVPAEHLINCFSGRTHWTNQPDKVINYISCHDNYTLYDRIAIALPYADHEEIAKRCRLAAAFTLLSLGVPFFQAGEEMLRSKRTRTGKIVENSYKSPDAVNALKWNSLDNDEVTKTVRYYKGLLKLRKHFSIFRISDPDEATKRITLLKAPMPAFILTGKTEQLICAFNPNHRDNYLSLPDGEWELLANQDTAGINCIQTVSDTIPVPAISALVLVRHFH